MAASKKRRRLMIYVPTEKKGWEAYPSRDEMSWYGPNGLRITIHKYIDTPPGQRFVSCHLLGIERVPLVGDMSDPKALKKEALDVVRRYVHKITKVLEKAR